MECSGDWDSGVQIAYIKVYKSEESRYYELGEGDILIEELNDGGYYMANQYFEVEIGTRGQIRALYLVGDEYRTNYVIDTDQAGIGHGVGELILSVKKEGEETYQEYFTTVSGDGRSFSIEDDKLVVTYENATGNKAINGFKVVETYQYVDDQLRWSATVENTGETDIVVGDWGIPIQFNENLSGTAEEIYQRRVVDHSFVGMDSSYLYATPGLAVKDGICCSPRKPPLTQSWSIWITGPVRNAPMKNPMWADCSSIISTPTISRKPIEVIWILTLL